MLSPMPGQVEKTGESNGPGPLGRIRLYTEHGHRESSTAVHCAREPAAYQGSGGGDSV